MCLWITSCFATALILTQQAGTSNPIPLQAWATSPIEIRVLFDRPLSAEESSKLRDSPILFGTTTDGNQPARGRLHVAGVTSADDGRTQILATDPHPWNTTFSLQVNSQVTPSNTQAKYLKYSLSGVEAVWEANPANAKEVPLTLWWPTLNLDAARKLATDQKSPSHLKLLEALQKPGTLTLKTSIAPSSQDRTLDLICDGSLVLESATVDNEPAKIEQNPNRALLMVPAGELPADLTVTIKTRPGNPAANLVYWRYSGKPDEAVHENLALPWSPAPAVATSATTSLQIPDLTGGNPTRGEAVFFGAEAKCSDCHAFRGRGKQVGPDLSEVRQQEQAWLYRAIAEPSTEIHPEYVTFTVAVNDGRILAGTVKAVDEQTLRVIDTGAHETILNRADVTEIRPSATSIMPVGLAGVLGPDKLRDLIAYLRSPLAKPE